MITEIWACLPLDGKMKEETLYGWTLTPEQVAEWKENAETGDEPVEYVQFVRKADAEAAQALVVERAGIAVANTEIGFHDGISGDWRPMDGPSIISACCAAIRALADPSGVAALAALRKERDGLRRNLRESFEAMCAMRDAINEHAPMPSLESDLLQGPEASVFCAAVAEAVVARLVILRGAVEDVVCGRGMFGVDPAVDLQWAIAHLGAALSALGVTPDEVRGSGGPKVRPNMGQIIAECDCPDGATCQIEGRCLAAGGPSCG